MISPIPLNLRPAKRAKASRPSQSGLIPNWQKVQRIQSQAVATGSGNILRRKSSVISQAGTSDSGSNSINIALPASQLGSIQVTDHSSSRAASSDAGAVSYGGFVPDDLEDGFAEMHDLQGKAEEQDSDKKLTSRYKVRRVQSLFNLNPCANLTSYSNSDTSLSPRSRIFTQRHCRGPITFPTNCTRRKKSHSKTSPRVPRIVSRRTCFPLHWIPQAL